MVFFPPPRIYPTIAGVLVAFCVPSNAGVCPDEVYQDYPQLIAHFSADEPEDLVKRLILDKEQMNWLKQVESASDKVISPLQDL